MDNDEPMNLLHRGVIDVTRSAEEHRRYTL